MGKQLDGLSPSDALDLVGDLIDDATDNALSGQARQAFEYCDALEKRLDATQRVELDYFRANAWSVIRQAKHRDESTLWEWDQKEILSDIFYLRSAVRSSEFSSLADNNAIAVASHLAQSLKHLHGVAESGQLYSYRFNPELFPVVEEAQV